MATTFLKRQKEMKRLEKQREKAERRAQKKLASRAERDGLAENVNPSGNDLVSTDAAAASGPEHQA